MAEVGWRYVFLAPAPVAVLIIIGAMRVLPNAKADVVGERHYDLPGAFSITSSMLLLVYSVVEAPTHGWTSARTLGGLAASALLAGLFVVIERRTRQPLVRLGILKVGRWCQPTSAPSCTSGRSWATSSWRTLYVQEVAHWSPIATAFAFLPSGFFLPILGAQAPRIIGRFGTPRLVAAGSCCSPPGTRYSWTQTPHT